MKVKSEMHVTSFPRNLEDFHFEKYKNEDEKTNACSVKKKNLKFKQQRLKIVDLQLRLSDIYCGL